MFFRISSFLRVLIPTMVLLAVSCATRTAGHKGNTQPDKSTDTKPVVCGADRTTEWLPLIQDKRVALVVNQTSLCGKTHLADTILSLGGKISKIFAPEHGFRGEAGAGETIKDGMDKRTGLPVVSLYGKNKKPSPEMLKDVDLVIYDIQDVGARFYTYISTLTYVMEACADLNIPVLVLDRPNPNGFYVDGPVLDKAYHSFIGMHEVPVVYGMTAAEYAHMVNEEGWLDAKGKCKLSWITCENYDHNTRYQLPVRPSPNLPDMRSIYLYPSICFFEGTCISEGRGTAKPFQIFGHPDLTTGDAYFTPMPNQGAPKPKLNGMKCRGYDLSTEPLDKLSKTTQLDLSYLIAFYDAFPDKDKFFNSDLFFNKLAGNALLIKQIADHTPIDKIRESWQPGLKKFLQLRKNYLLYADFN